MLSPTAMFDERSVALPRLPAWPMVDFHELLAAMPVPAVLKMMAIQVLAVILAHPPHMALEIVMLLVVPAKVRTSLLAVEMATA